MTHGRYSKKNARRQWSVTQVVHIDGLPDMISKRYFEAEEKAQAWKQRMERWCIERESNCEYTLNKEF